MKIISTLVLLVLIALSVYPCSIFKYATAGRTYFCGNEDWIASDPAIQTIKPKDNDYGCILFGWRSFLPRYVQAGINSKGLCFDWAAVPQQRFVRDATKKDLSLDFTVEVLKRCANVDEAIEYISSYNIPHLAEEHIMLADRTGKSCVIEYNHSQLQLVRDNSEFQFMTNFHLTDKSLGWYPCDRHAKMAAFFNERGNKETRLVELLDRVHQEGQYPTVYSYVFDLSSMKITVYYNHNYRSGKTWSLGDLTAKDAILDISRWKTGPPKFSSVLGAQGARIRSGLFRICLLMTQEEAP